MFTPLAFKQPQLVTNGLLLYLDAADRTSYVSGSTVWRDLSGGNNGTLTNGPTFNAGSTGGSIVFDGTNDYVSFSSTSTFNLSGINFSINLWFNSNAWTTTWQAIFAKGDDSWRVHRYSSSTPAKIAFGTQGLSIVDTYTNTSFNTNTWYNITCIYDGTSKKIYVNGVLDDNQNVTGAMPAGNYIPYIGENSQAVGRYFNGSVAIAQIYNRALSAQEVLQNFNAQRQRFNI